VAFVAAHFSAPLVMWHRAMAGGALQPQWTDA
jgi:hypothetical protein